MIAKREDISKYIPQREPMVLVHELLEHNEEYSLSAFDIEEEHVLVEDGQLSEAGILENMAQTAALSKGYEYVQREEQVPIGFIGAVKNFKIFNQALVGQRVETKLQIKHEVLNASIVNTTMTCNGIEIASCELKIFINPQIQ